MLPLRLRRWPNISPALAQHLVFAGLLLNKYYNMSLYDITNICHYITNSHSSVPKIIFSFMLCITYRRYKEFEKINIYTILNVSI